MEQLNFVKNILIDKKDALIVVDIQNDFIPGGALAVDEGDLIIKGINNLIKLFNKRNAKVVLTQDWHPQNHKSFASNHPGKKPGDKFSSEDGAIGPVLWPDHCVQKTKGADFHKDLKTKFGDKIIRKGMNPNIDSYSGFRDNLKRAETGLKDYLNSLNLTRIFICGLALDYCCQYTAIDGIDFGFEVYVVVDLTKGIDLPKGNVKIALENMRNKGVKFANQDSFKS